MEKVPELTPTWVIEVPQKRGNVVKPRVKASRTRSRGKVSCGEPWFEFRMGVYTRLGKNNAHDKYDTKNGAV